MSLLALRLGMLAIGVWLLTTELRRLLNARRSLTWRPTEGEILYTRIEEGSPIRIGDDAGRSEELFRPRVKFQYQVAGRTFVSEQLSFRPMDVLGYGNAIDALSSYRKGKRVPVYFNPANPAEAVLVRGPTTASYSVVGGYAAAVVFVLWKILGES